MDFVVPISYKKNNIIVDNYYVPSKKILLIFEDNIITSICKVKYFIGYENYFDKYRDNKDYIDEDFVNYLNEKFLSSQTPSIDFNQINKEFHQGMQKCNELLIKIAKDFYDEKRYIDAMLSTNKVIYYYCKNKNIITSSDLLQEAYKINILSKACSHNSCVDNSCNHNYLIYNYLKISSCNGLTNTDFYFDDDFKKFKDDEKIIEIINDISNKNDKIYDIEELPINDDNKKNKKRKAEELDQDETVDALIQLNQTNSKN